MPIPQWTDRREERPISINVTGGRAAPSAAGGGGEPKWLIPAIIAAATLL